VNFTDGTAEFLPFLPLTTTQAQPGTNFVLDAYDIHGNMIESLEFALQPAVNESPATNAIDNADFFVALTNNGNINSVVLSCNGQALTEITAPSTLPTVSLTYPNGGQTFNGGSINVAWTGSDSSGETLTYTVQYSADDGATWQTLCIDLPSEGLAVNSAQLAATTQGLIRVTVSDGFNTATAQSAATFTVQPHPPAVIINAPVTGSVFIQDQQLFLDASIYDMQDGSLTGTNVQWNSDRDGFLGTGAIINMDATVLSEGYHIITATAKDNEGLTNSATTQILVLHYAQPQMSAQYTPALNGYPASGTVTWPSYYTNYVLQTSSNLASGWKTITNNPPEVLGNQQSVTLSATNKATFFRLMLQP
jgi:hypothetical protein